MEVLTFILSSHEENFDMLNRTDDKSKAVIIANPRTSEFEVTPAECSHHLALLFFKKQALLCVLNFLYSKNCVMFG